MEGKYFKIGVITLGSVYVLCFLSGSPRKYSEIVYLFITKTNTENNYFVLITDTAPSLC